MHSICTNHKIGVLSCRVARTCARMEADVDLVGGQRPCLVSDCRWEAANSPIHCVPSSLLYREYQTQMEPHITTLGRAQYFQISRHPTRVLSKTFVTLPTDVGMSVSQQRKPREYPLPAHRSSPFTAFRCRQCWRTAFFLPDATSFPFL